MEDSMKDDQETIAAVRAMRAEHARAAAYYAYRAQQARAASRHTEAARWTDEYCHAVASCRRLGKVIHGDPPTVDQAGAAGPPSAADPRVHRFGPVGPEGDIPTTGAAA
jgi:hypothetical protein